MRCLKDEDIPEILEPAKTNPLYYKHNPPNPSAKTIKKDMLDLPPGSTQKDKYFIGFFDEDKLIAILDLILHYPNPQSCFIGLFMVHKKYQRKGLGTQIIQDCLSYLGKFYSVARLGYISTNKQSKNFWLKNGFYQTGEKYQHPKYLVEVMEKTLVHKM
ncbi:MAG: GNAT family N-acetyltransferase [Alphaproteobacteria bacterium]|nr:GNAT family N-acetyltransferase [Alphaproteobacteria bacterium]